MEVAHNEHLDSHTVVGGAKARAFGIAESAEFINMLSEGLYSNKKLAVVREILCNSWDAHVISGRTDIPVQIKITSNQLSFRDFGPGIHDDLIAQVYCVYGASTKAHNGEENGGFGLGSKAPFAYTPHFTVTSHHGGMKYIYAISRGSTETDGKPDLREMVSVPTEEEGIDVSLPVKSEDDMQDFIRLITQIAYFGEMKVELNGELLPTLNFSQSPHGFMVIDRDVPSLDRYPFTSTIYLRYGTVIYPVTHDESYSEEYQKLKKLVESSAGNKTLIFQTDPNTIAVTPSRESLSLTERTKESIRGKLAPIVQLFEGQAIPAYRKMVKNYTKGATESGDVNALRKMVSKEKFDAKAEFMKKYIEASMDNSTDLLNLMMLRDDYFKRTGTVCYIEAAKRRQIMSLTLRKYDPDNVDLYDQIDEVTNSNLDQYRQEHIISAIWNFRIQDKIEAVLGDNAKYLKYVHRDWGGRKYHSAPVKASTGFMDYRYPTESIVSDQVVVVAHSQTGANEFLDSENIDDQHMFAVICTRKKGLSDDIINDLEASAYEVIDATSFVNTNTRVSSNPRGAGYLKLKETVNDSGFYKEGLLSEPGYDRETDPDYVFWQEKGGRWDNAKVAKVNSDLLDILQLMPNAVIVSSESVAANVVSKFGAKYGPDAMFEIVCKEAEDNPNVIQHLADVQESSDSFMKDLLKIGEYDPDIAKLLARTKVTDKRAIASANIIKRHNNRYGTSIGHRNKMQEIMDKVDEFKDSDPVIKALTENPYLRVVNLNRIVRAIKDKDPNLPEFLTLLHLAIEG